MLNNILLGSLVIIIIFLIGCFITLIFCFKAIANYLNYKKRQSYIDKHIHYMTILDYYMEKSFDIIYKDRILVYSIEGTKPSDEDIKTNTIDFTKLTLQLLGPNLVEEFISLYGTEETLFLIMAEYFNTKSETDEIKQESINQIMKGSDDEII